MLHQKENNEVVEVRNALCDLGNFQNDAKWHNFKTQPKTFSIKEVLVLNKKRKEVMKTIGNKMMMCCMVCMCIPIPYGQKRRI